MNFLSVSGLWTETEWRIEFVIKGRSHILLTGFSCSGRRSNKGNMAGKHLWATPLSSDSTTSLEELGILRREWSGTDSCFKTYRYVQTASDTTVANGTALGFSDKFKQVASSDTGDYEENQPLGVGIGVITASSYGWIQTGGYHPVVATDGSDDIVDGDDIILHDSSNGVVIRSAAGSAPGDNTLGIAVVDDINGDNTVAVYLTLNEI